MFDAKYKSSYVSPELYSKVDDFWKWFDFKRLDIENAIKEGNKNILSEISEELKKVYSGKVVYFALGYKDEKYVLYLYYKRSSFLLIVTSIKSQKFYINSITKNWKIRILRIYIY